jgi:hypothetical protein
MTDQPREHDDRPWEHAGVLRRDCEPHRARWLRALAVTALLCAATGACLALPALTGMVLGIAVWVMGRRDRARMAAGLMDPAGEEETWDAVSMAGIAVALCLLAAVSWAAVLLTKLPS